MRCAAAGVGTVEKIGPDATKFKVGQRVVGVPWPGVPHGNGTWQQYYVAPESVLVRFILHTLCSSSHTQQASSSQPVPAAPCHVCID